MIHVFVSLIGRWDWVLEHVIERDVKYAGDLERHLEGRRVPATLDGDDGLARYAVIRQTG